MGCVSGAGPARDSSESGLAPRPRRSDHKAARSSRPPDILLPSELMPPTRRAGMPAAARWSHDEGLLESIERWTAPRRAALVMSILKGETLVQEAARKHSLTVAEVESRPLR